MEQGFSENLAAEQLVTVLDLIRADIKILKAVRVGGNITRFELVMTNKVGGNVRADRDNFSPSQKNFKVDEELLHRMIGVVETGVGFHTLVSEQMDGMVRQFKQRYAKFGDGLLLAKIPFDEKSGVNSSAEDAVRDQAFFIQQVFEIAPDIITVLEIPSLYMVYSNRKNLAAHGFDRDRLMKMSMQERRELIHPEDRLTLENYFGRFGKPINDEELVTAEYRAKNENGDWLWFLVRGRVFERHADGRVRSIVNVIQNITAAREAERVRKEAQLSLARQQASLENLKLIVDSTHDAIISLDGDRKINYWNPAAETIYGYKADQAVGKRPDELIVPEKDKPELKKMLARIYDEDIPLVNSTAGHKTKNGRLIDVMVTLFPLLDSSGEISGSCLVSKDITEDKKNREQLREDAHFISHILDTTPDIVYIMDLNTHQVLYTNRPVATKLGYTKAQLDKMHNSFLDIIHDDDRPAMKEHLRKMKHLSSDDQVVEIEYRLIAANGDICWFCDRNAVFKRNNRKVPIEKIAFSQDITSRKIQEDQLLTGNDILAQAEEITSMGSWEYELATGSFKWSAGMYKLFNLPNDVPVSPGIYFDLAAEGESVKVAEIVNKITHEPSAFEEVIRLQPKDQEIKTIRIKAMPVRDRKNNTVKMVGVDWDITRYVKATGAIDQLNRSLLAKNRELAELNAELKSFNSVTANDFRETLQILYTNLEYITNKDGRNLGDSSKANIRRGQAAIQKMKLLTEDINNYLQLYDIGIQRALIDPNELLENVISKMQSKIDEARANIEMAEMPALLADPLLFSRLMTNLLDNALKFRKLISAPVIRIRYSQADEMNAIAGSLPDTPYAIVSVADNGIGFTEEEAERIFDLFYRIPSQARNRGSGIGLASCKRIMAMHGGFITAEASPATGATFNCYFPMK